MSPTIDIPNLKYFASQGMLHGCIIEQKPCRRTVMADGLRNLPFPYLYFYIDMGFYNEGIRFNQLYVFFSGTPLERLDDEVLMSPLPNQSMGLVCMGDSFDDYKCFEDTTSLIKSVIAAFWQTSFADYIAYPIVTNGKRAETFEQWSKLSVSEILEINTHNCTDGNGFNVGGFKLSGIEVFCDTDIFFNSFEQKEVQPQSRLKILLDPPISWRSDPLLTTLIRIERLLETTNYRYKDNFAKAVRQVAIFNHYSPSDEFWASEVIENERLRLSAMECVHDELRKINKFYNCIFEWHIVGYDCELDLAFADKFITRLKSYSWINLHIADDAKINSLFPPISNVRFFNPQNDSTHFDAFPANFRRKRN